MYLIFLFAKQNIWSRLPEAFHQFLSGIGCIKDISDHSGWTGNLQTSYRTSNGYLVTGHCNQTKNIHADHCPDGIQSIIYYADAITELACICPTNQFYGNEENSDSNLSLKSTRYRTASEIISKFKIKIIVIGLVQTVRIKWDISLIGRYFLKHTRNALDFVDI